MDDGIQTWPGCNTGFVRDDPEVTGVGEWCSPGPAVEQRRKWLVVFDDSDMGPVPFDDETEARAWFAKAEGRGFNCYLFETARRVPNAKVSEG